MHKLYISLLILALPIKAMFFFGGPVLVELPSQAEKLKRIAENELIVFLAKSIFEKDGSYLLDSGQIRFSDISNSYCLDSFKEYNTNNLVISYYKYIDNEKLISTFDWLSRAESLKKYIGYKKIIIYSVHETQSEKLKQIGFEKIDKSWHKDLSDEQK